MRDDSDLTQVMTNITYINYKLMLWEKLTKINNSCSNILLCWAIIILFIREIVAKEICVSLWGDIGLYSLGNENVALHV